MSDWPVLTRYDADHLARIALPLGGIGTGTISLGGRGDLRDWEIVNRPAKGFTPDPTFFVLRTAPVSGEGEAVTRLLEGPMDTALYEGSSGSVSHNHGLPRFRHCTFEAAYPLGQVVLSDPEVPLRVRLQAFNPLIPGDAARSGLPVAVLRFVLENTGDTAVRAAICGTVTNFIGNDGVNKLAKANRNTFRQEAQLAGIFCETEGVPPEAETWGTMALCTLNSEGTPSHRTAWARLSWGDSLLDFWDDFSRDGILEERARDERDETPTASLAQSVVVAPHSTESITFLLSWHFPNRMSWTPDGFPGGKWLSGGACEDGPPLVGNWYATQDRDAWAVACRVAQDLPTLEADTMRFVKAFCDSDLPPVVKEAALYNLSTLRTQTVFRTPDGKLFGWEGCHDHQGSCLGSCTHVWNYETTTAFLFGDLARTMREVEFRYATRPDTGHMRFRVPLPLSEGADYGDAGLAAADGQMGCLMKLYRDWRLCGDTNWLRGLWPQARKALEFCWTPGGWDADHDGVMEGCQHNTMDVEYYGPNPQMGTWYLGALRACEEMARVVGEGDFADECRCLFENGSRWMDANLFNGDYYEHHIVSPGDKPIAPGLRHGSMGAQNLTDPELQLGAGCLVDQLVGQSMAHVCGLGYLLKPENIQATLASILRYNFRENHWSHFNHMRSYVLADEASLLMASYPRGRRPTRPFPYYNETMTGFEYTAATHLIYEGDTQSGLRVIQAIRDRYDGKKRSPFNEAECGHHYARAMAAHAAVLALTGFDWDGATQTLRFATLPENVPAQTHFWSNGTAWGTCRLEGEGGEFRATLEVLHGTLTVRRFALAGAEGGVVEFPFPASLVPGKPLTLALRSKK